MVYYVWLVAQCLDDLRVPDSLFWIFVLEILLNRNNSESECLIVWWQPHSYTWCLSTGGELYWVPSHCYKAFHLRSLLLGPESLSPRWSLVLSIVSLKLLTAKVAYLHSFCWPSGLHSWFPHPCQYMSCSPLPLPIPSPTQLPPSLCLTIAFLFLSF